MNSGPGDLGRLVVAVLTYQRAADILELVPQLVSQIREVGGDSSVLVVDNDPVGGAREGVTGLGLTEVRYVHEPRPGIAHARNRALEECTEAQVLVFIDDDERPADGWLATLVSCYRETGATAVAGAVVPDVGLIEDEWISKGEFFVRQRHRTGTELKAASTANLLVDLQRVRELGDLRFDARYGTTGGSDTLFTRTLVLRGGRIVWCDEAVVVDYIRSARLTRSWVLQRAFRSGNSWGRCEVETSGPGLSRLLTRLRLVGAAVVRIALGAFRALGGRTIGSLRHQARGSRTMARGKGMLAGARGSVYEEYRRSGQETAA